MKKDEAYKPLFWNREVLQFLFLYLQGITITEIQEELQKPEGIIKWIEKRLLGATSCADQKKLLELVSETLVRAAEIKKARSERKVIPFKSNKD